MIIDVKKVHENNLSPVAAHAYSMNNVLVFDVQSTQADDITLNSLPNNKVDTRGWSFNTSSNYSGPDRRLFSIESP
jgi:hypothetical protein